MASISRLFRSGLIMVSIMIVTMLYLKAEKKNIVSSQSQLELTQHGTVEIPIETYKKKPIFIEPSERRYHIISTKVKFFNTRSLWDLKYLHMSMVWKILLNMFYRKLELGNIGTINL